MLKKISEKIISIRKNLAELSLNQRGRFYVRNKIMDQKYYFVVNDPEVFDRYKKEGWNTPFIHSVKNTREILHVPKQKHDFALSDNVKERQEKQEKGEIPNHIPDFQSFDVIEKMTPQNAKLYVKDYIANKNEMAINKAHINAMKKIKEPDSAIGLNYYIHSGIEADPIAKNELLMLYSSYDTVLQNLEKLDHIDIIRGNPQKWQVLDERVVGIGTLISRKRK